MRADDSRRRRAETRPRQAGEANRPQFSNDLPPACYEQLTSECQAVLYTRGQPHRVFERYPSRLAEILDRAVYALAAKSVVGTGEA